MLYTLNVYSAMYQLYLNKTGGKISLSDLKNKTKQQKKRVW